MMKKICIITDSHSGISQDMAEKLHIKVLPMPFFIDDECFYEGINLSRESYFDKMKETHIVRTSQPSPEILIDCWDTTLEEYEQILYIPISSGLSGACSSAFTLSQQEKYLNRVYVVDNGRVSTALHRSVLDAVELMEEGYSAKEIKTILEQSKDKTVIYVTVNNLDYLKNGGRISPTTATLGNVLNIKPIFKFDIGLLDVYRKCRGFTKAKSAMIEAMKNDFDTKFYNEYKRGDVYLLAASSADKDTTESWVAEIRAAFPDMDVMCDDLPLSISCHIGPGGLGIGCSCRPVRL